ncbi:MAG: hypothetical protein ACO3FA_02315 [Vulcanococcus sp.]|jgi:hypothetical protein
MPIALRWSAVTLLSLLGLAGLVQLPLAPPLASRPGAATERVLANLASQEASQEAQERATQLLSRFVGAEITRYFWGGFSGYLDVLGLEAPEDMRVSIREQPEAVQLLLVPREGQERYVARVAAQDNVPRGVACQGQGEPGAFTWRGDSLRCPVGWQELPLQGPRHHSER